MKVVRKVTRLGLRESVDLVDSAPVVIKGRLEKEAAEMLAADLRNGAAGEVRQGEVANTAYKEPPPTYEESLDVWLSKWLQPGEAFEAAIRTGELIFKKDVVFTSERILIATDTKQPEVEAIPYRSIAAFRTSSWGTKDITLELAGRRQFDLRLANALDRDRALELLNRHSV